MPTARTASRLCLSAHLPPNLELVSRPTHFESHLHPRRRGWPPLARRRFGHLLRFGTFCPSGRPAPRPPPRQTPSSRRLAHSKRTAIAIYLGTPPVATVRTPGRACASRGFAAEQLPPAESRHFCCRVARRGRLACCAPLPPGQNEVDQEHQHGLHIALHLHPHLHLRRLRLRLLGLQLSCSPRRSCGFLLLFVLRCQDLPIEVVGK
mmetsp:Transcript_7540/g.18169  ORF Transcript_7540/g.18169 Transcript_7540/m.18169 type:complete len:207 (-) Transcript_7540:2029-2649(-)